jgi:LacI family transcriptional regulator
MTKKSTSFTIRDVAREAKVSVATVSRYINHSRSVLVETGERLEKVMMEFQFIPHSGARQLATRKTRLIGLLLTNMHNDFFMPVLNGVESAVRENGNNSIKQFLASTHPEFDAVFAGNDEAAYWAIAALKEAGFKVPEEIAVVGFDDQ